MKFRLFALCLSLMYSRSCFANERVENARDFVESFQVAMETLYPPMLERLMNKGTLSRKLGIDRHSNPRDERERFWENIFSGRSWRLGRTVLAMGGCGIAALCTNDEKLKILFYATGIGIALADHAVEIGKNVEAFFLPTTRDIFYVRRVLSRLRKGNGFAQTGEPQWHGILSVILEEKTAEIFSEIGERLQNLAYQTEIQEKDLKEVFRLYAEVWTLGALAVEQYRYARSSEKGYQSELGKLSSSQNRISDGIGECQVLLSQVSR